MLKISEPTEFVWDKGNRDKNWRKHKVNNQECEEVFFDARKVILRDILHSKNEDRYFLLGKTKAKRLLFIVFTLRGKKVRIVSARDINRKEVRLYEKKV